MVVATLWNSLENKVCIVLAVDVLYTWVGSGSPRPYMSWGECSMSGVILVGRRYDTHTARWPLPKGKSPYFLRKGLLAPSKGKGSLRPQEGAVRQFLLVVRL